MQSPHHVLKIGASASRKGSGAQKYRHIPVAFRIPMQTRAGRVINRNGSEEQKDAPNEVLSPTFGGSGQLGRRFRPFLEDLIDQAEVPGRVGGHEVVPLQGQLDL